MSGTVSGLGTATNQTEPSTLGRCTIYKLFDVFRLLTISPTRAGILCDLLTTRFPVSSVNLAENRLYYAFAEE